MGSMEKGPVSEVLAALARDDPNGVVAALDGQLHHGRPGSPAARRDKPDRVPDLMRILEPLLRDPTPYVRRNLGPFALGDGMLRVDPKATLKYLREWSNDRDQIVRWNTAMAFSSAIGSFHWPAAKGTLERL